MGEKLDRHSEEVSLLDRELAPGMFAVALAFLLITGAYLHLTEGHLFGSFGVSCLISLGVLYLLIVGETVVHWQAGSKNMRQHVRYLLLPILRLCPRDHIDGTRVWVPVIGWRKTTERFEHYLARIFSGPMIVVALLVLPVVAVEFIWFEQVSSDATWKFWINTCSGFIWMAFVFEFVVMVSVVERKVRYCKRNWIDLAIVLLPLISFIGAARLSRLVKLKQLARTARIYRIRGLALRTWRAVVTLNVIDTLLRRDGEYRMERLKEQIEEKQREIELLHQELKRIQIADAKKLSKRRERT